LNLSSEKLDRHGVFLLEDGQAIYLYFGKEAVPELVHAILGIPSLEGLDTTQVFAV
jgi:protein transport protein SEC24